MRISLGFFSIILSNILLCLLLQFMKNGNISELSLEYLMLCNLGLGLFSLYNLTEIKLLAGFKLGYVFLWSIFYSIVYGLFFFYKENTSLIHIIVPDSISPVFGLLIYLMSNREINNFRIKEILPVLLLFIYGYFEIKFHNYEDTYFSIFLLFIFIVCYSFSQFAARSVANKIKKNFLSISLNSMFNSFFLLIILSFKENGIQNLAKLDIKVSFLIIILMCLIQYSYLLGLKHCSKTLSALAISSIVPISTIVESLMLGIPVNLNSFVVGVVYLTIISLMAIHDEKKC